MWAAVIAAVLGTLWVTGQTPQAITSGQKDAKPPSAEVAANAQAVKDSGEAVGYWHDIAVSAQKQAAELQGQVDAARTKKDAENQKIASSAQYFNEGTINALRRIPADKRCPESVLAIMFAEKTDTALAGLVGTMTPEQQKDVADLVTQFLAADDKAREEAQKKLDEKDSELRQALRERDTAAGQVAGLQTAIDAQKITVASAQDREKLAIEELNTRTEQLTSSLSTQTARAASDVWFWRLWLIGVIGLLFLTGRVIPLLSHMWPWLSPLNKLNAFLFRLITGKHAVCDSDYDRIQSQTK